MSNNIYLARQPIVDRESRLVGFELLFRRGAENVFVEVDGQVATSSVAIGALSEFGADAVLSDNAGFINCNADFLMSDALELLPPDKIVLEILECTAADDALIKRCMELKSKGYRIALDDFAGINEVNRGLVPLADIVKVDIRDLRPGQLEEVTSQLLPFNTTLLAEKIETEAEFQRCLSLGYRYFQGYYFSRPEIIAGKRLSRGQMALTRIMALLQKEHAEIGEIEEIFKEHPTLGVSLLRLANSVASGLRVPLKSISAAIYALGRRQLERWTLLLLMAEGREDGKQSLLLHVAATRGKFMELLAPMWEAHPGLADSAFIVGVVSVMDGFLGKPMNEVVESLGLCEEMRDALLERKGTLGTLLALAESLEAQEGGMPEEFVRQHAGEVGEMLNSAQGQALAWANKVLKAA